MHSSHKNKSSRADKAIIFMGISHNNFPGECQSECQSEYVRHKPAAFIRKPIKLWKFSTSVFFVRVPPSTAYPVSLSFPSLSLLLYLLAYTSIFGHVYVACGTRWTNMQLVISATQRPPLPLIRPWSGCHIKRTTRPEHVPGPSCRRRTCSSENHSSARARLVIHMDEYDVHTLGPCARRA